MVCIRKGWLVVVLGLAFAQLAACKKNEGAAPGAGGDKSAEKAGEKAAEKAANGAVSDDDIALLPVDSEVVIGVDVAQVRASALWKEFVEPKLASGESMRAMNEFKVKCGFDPVSSIRSVALGFKVGDKPDGVVVVHGIDKSKTLECADKAKADVAKEGTEITRDGDIITVKSKDGETSVVKFLNDDTLIGVAGEKASAEGLKAVLAGSALKSSPQFIEMYGKINSKDSLWFLINGRLLDRMAALGVKPKAVYGALHVGDGLALDYRMRMESPEAATQLAAMAKGQLAQAEKMVDKVDVSTDGAEFKTTIAMSKEKLKAMIQQFAGLLGGLGGMGAH